MNDRSKSTSSYKKVTNDTSQRFDPVKQDVEGKRAMRAVWSTDAFARALDGLQQGRKLVANPFYENNTKLTKGDLVFQRTPEECEEFLRCMNDINYFAEKYCKLMTPEGIRNITLRKYQREYLEHLQKNRLSIFISCRQAGKCISLLTNVLVKINDNADEFTVDTLKNCLDSCYFNSESNTYCIPVFELMNLYRTDFKWKVKYVLYKMIFKLSKCKKVKK